MQFGGVDLSYGVWSDVAAALGWVLLAGPALIWFGGQTGVLPKGRNIGIYTPVLTAFVGGAILAELRRWPF